MLEVIHKMLKDIQFTVIIFFFLILIIKIGFDNDTFVLSESGTNNATE